MNELYSLKYHMFLAEQLEEQSKFEACVNEAILMSSGEANLEKINLLQESVVDKMKEGIMKIIEALGRLWSKFVEAMDILIKKDKAYLEKYKETILKKKPVNADYTMYDYQKGVGHILRSPVPVFSYNTMKDDLADREKFIDKYFRKYTLGNNDTNFIDGLKAYFRGSVEQRKINSSQLNMTDMYNYCHEYDKMKSLIEKDLKYIEKAGSDGVNLVEKMGREEKLTQESSKIFKDNKFMSFLYEQYITEEEANKNSNDKKTSATNPAADRVVKGGDANGPKPSSQYQGASGNKEDSKMNEKDVQGSTVKDASEKIKVYIKVCSDFIAAKLTIAEEIYKAYMSIIKTHVRDHLGKSGDNKPVDNSSDYNKSGEDKPETPKEKEKQQEDEKKAKEADKKMSGIKGFFSRVASGADKSADKKEK